MSSVVVLRLMLRYVYFSYLIRIVVFVNRYRSLDCCTVLSGSFPAVFVVVGYFLIFSLFFSCLVVGLVLQRGCVPSPGC